MTVTLLALVLAAILLPPVLAALALTPAVSGSLRPWTDRPIRLAARGLWVAAVASAAGVGLATLSETAALGPVRLDGAALVLVPLIAFVGATVAQFAVTYMSADRRPETFARRLLWLVVAALLVSMSRDAILFTAAWLATGPLLAALVGHLADWQAAAAARRRMLVTFLPADAALVAGVALLILSTGETAIAAISAEAAALSPWLRDPALAALLVAALARSAILPLGGWLMTSLTAPTPVSALMHAGLVNAGGIAVALWLPVLVQAPYLLHALFALGAATALLGSASMLVRADIKRSLAASTMGQMGFMMMQCGLGAIAHAVYHLAAHGLFKAALFLGAGSNVAPARARRKPRPGLTVAAALGGVGLVALLQALATGEAPSLANPATLLMIFAVLAAAQTLGTLPPQVSRLGESFQIVALMAAFAALYAAGLGLTTLALGGDASVTAIAVGPLHWAVGAIFAALWVAQLLLVARGGSLPPRLYAALLSLGRSPVPDLQAALHATGRGASGARPQKS